MPAEALAAVTPLLLGSGAAALAWRRLRSSPLGGTPGADDLRQAYRLFPLQAVIQERDLREAVGRLRAAGAEPVLVKGWAVARLYPEPGLRPYGDLDLCVRRKDFERAGAALDGLRGLETIGDLHDGFSTLDEQGEDDLFARSELADCA